MNNFNTSHVLLPGNEHVTEQTVILVKDILRQYRTDKSMSCKMVYEAYNAIFQKHDKAQTCQSCVIRRFRHIEAWALKNNIIKKDDDITSNDNKQYPTIRLRSNNGEIISAYIVMSVEDDKVIYHIKKENGEILESASVSVKDIPKYDGYNLVEEFKEVEITNLVLLSGEIVIRNTRTKTVERLNGNKLKSGKYELADGGLLVISPNGSRIVKK